MKAEEIRANKVCDESFCRSEPNAACAYYLQEIAAQLAELNETLRKVVVPFGSTSHVVNVCPTDGGSR